MRIQVVGNAYRFLPKTVREANGEDRKEAGIAQVVIVAHFEGSEVLLEARILIDRLTTHRSWIIGIAGASREGYLQTRLADIVEAHLNRKAEVAAVTRYDVAEAQTEARRDFMEVDASRAMERIGVTADVVLAVQGNVAPGGNHGSSKNAVVIAKDNLRAEAEVSPKGKPVQSRVAGAELQIDPDIGSLFLKTSRVAEEVGTGAQVELRS